jgi:elongation factor P hydroxylase
VVIFLLIILPFEYYIAWVGACGVLSSSPLCTYPVNLGVKYFMNNGELSSESQNFCAKHLEDIFRACFYQSHGALLIGGYDQPCYLPANHRRKAHQLRYREDYFASALHEAAHWCIAGERRRRMVDFAYWYHPDGRTAAQQRQFEAVEVKPQALEWIFSVAAGARFRLSEDNLTTGGEPRDSSFANNVYQQVLRFCDDGLPVRGERFAQAIAAEYGVADPRDNGRYSLSFLTDNITVKLQTGEDGAAQGISNL